MSYSGWGCHAIGGEDTFTLKTGQKGCDTMNEMKFSVLFDFESLQAVSSIKEIFEIKLC